MLSWFNWHNYFEMFVILIAATLVVYICYLYLSYPKNLPPGPPGIPLFGYLPWLAYYSGDRVKLFNRLREKYGDIVCMRTGFSYIIVVSDLNLIKDGFANKGDHFSGRGLKMLQNEITRGKGILSNEGKYQRENRRFILRSLRNLGFGKMSFEEPIIETINTLRDRIEEHISEHGNETMDLRFSLTEAVADNITQIILGTKFSKEQLTFMISRLRAIESVPAQFLIMNTFPFLVPLLKFKIFKKLFGIQQFKDIREPLQDMVQKYVLEHKKNFDKDNIDDFLYSYIEEQSKHQDSKTESFWWDDHQIMHACTELIAAGMGTTESTITWSVMLMANNQTWQKKVQREIESVIGSERAPSTRDLASLPLCEATILEIFRWSALAPTGIPHAMMEDSELGGYFIPKGATVLPNIYALSRDERVWADPDNFNPEANFLSADRTHVINREKMIPFSVGRRSCIGESLARMEVTLFFLGIFQKYTVSLDPKFGMAKPSPSLFRFPDHRKIRFMHRRKSVSILSTE